MVEELLAVRSEIEARQVTAQSLVRLYNAATEAEHRRDLAALAEARELAQRLAAVVDAPLALEARRLVALCAELLERVEETVASTAATCPACGRELSGSPVRCRACGELLV